LQHFGVTAVTLLSEPSDLAAPFARRATLRPDLKWVQASGEKLWEEAEAAFSTFAEAGAELVLVLRVGPYVEVDYEEFIQHHLDKRCRVTKAVDQEGASVQHFVLTASRRNDASFLFRSELQKMRMECEDYQVKGYVNRLTDVPDLRRLGLDALMGKNSVRPVGVEWKPGVWVGEGARVHRKARIVAPAFIGAQSKIRASALITRGSVIEHHSEVDCGTVVESSTILPYTYVGAGLDVMHSVVGFHKLNHLVRGAEVEISDSRLVGMSALSPISRTVGSAAALFSFLPKQIYRALVGSSQRKSAAEFPESMEQPSAALDPTAQDVSGLPDTAASELRDQLLVARRYGDQ
jgi:hypothetical protein